MRCDTIRIRYDTIRYDTIYDTIQYDKTRQDTTRQDKTRQDKTRQGKTRQDKTRQDKTRSDPIRWEYLCKTRFDGGAGMKRYQALAQKSGGVSWVCQRNWACRCAWSPRPVKNPRRRCGCTAWMTTWHTCVGYWRWFGLQVKVQVCEALGFKCRVEVRVREKG